MTQLWSHHLIGKYCHLLLDLGTGLGSKSTTMLRPDNKQNCCRTGEECECDELCLKIFLPLAYGVVNVLCNL